jgi:hypothetical protein
VSGSRCPRASGSAVAAAGRFPSRSNIRETLAGQERDAIVVIVRIIE